MYILTIKTTLSQKVKPETEKTKNHKFYEYRYNNPLSIINSMAKIIEANNLTKIYGEKETSVTALDDINIEFRENEFTAIMGPSGSGKSTLLHCLAGLDRPSSGKIFLKGNDIATLNDKELTKIRRDSFGFIFQAFNLIPTLTAEENITLPASIAGRQPDMEWVKEVVETVDIADRLSHRPNELSGGQQQRVAAARAMATKPEVIFADEPSGNLDSKSSRELLTFMKSVVEELNQTIVMVTHDPYAASFAGRVVMLKDGKIASDLEKPTQEEIVAEVTALTNV